MFRRIQLTLCLSLALLGAVSAMTSNVSAAGMDWDIDYEVYVGVDAVKYEIWIDPVDGPPYVASSWPTLNEANYRLFKMVEWNQIPRNAEVEVETVYYTEWKLWETFETLDMAEDVAEQFEMFGFEAKIVPVFGGFTYRRERNYGIGTTNVPRLIGR